MSIFKGTFEEYVQKQITLRQNLLNTQGNRPLDVQKYVSGKSPWVKMTSFVDYVQPNVKKDSTSTKDIVTDPMLLAKRYVLQGGTLYPDLEDKFSFKLRSGILNKESAYGTDLGSKSVGKTNLQYGIRPMPGITSVSVKSKSAYGSLREAVVKFYAWDVKQLEDLLILFMRPGYPVLLEWGWSTYIDNADGKVKSFESPTIDCFQRNITQDIIYDKLEKYKKQFSGNYDGMMGLIRNYETSMLPNGGFECTTTLISIGDVIDSLKMNSENGDFVETKNVDDKKEYKDEFELLLSAFQYKMDEITEPVLKSRITELKAEASSIPGIDTTIYKGVNSFGSVDIGSDKTGDARYSCYMQLGYLIHILNVEKNLYSAGNKLLDIEIPLYTVKDNFGEGTCIASNNSMTIDNNICIIKNTNAKIVSNTNGFSPNVRTVEDVAIPLALTSAINNMNEYLIENTNLGVIGNVYVNLGRIIDIYKSEHQKNEGDVFLGKFIKSILKEIQFALGSINSFDIYVNDNKIVIIDKHYVEVPGESKFGPKFQINSLGTDSTIRNQKIVSKIFPSQATMIAIAAQSRENIASLQSSTYNYMNKGLTSRIFTELNEKTDDIQEKENKENDIFVNNIIELLDYVREYVVNFNQIYAFEKNKTTFNTLLNNFLVKVDKATNYRAIIPVSFELQLDGIGGAKIGQIFTINKDILPREYNDKKVGFIVTGISHEIDRPDWKTTFQTQFCLLDQEERQKEIGKISEQLLNNVNQKIKDKKEVLINSVNLHNTFVGFFCDIFRHRFTIRPIDGTYNTSVKSKLVYKQGTAVRNLKALIEQYKPTYNGSPISVDDMILEAENCINSFLTDMYERDKASSGSKVVAFSNVKLYVTKFNNLVAENLYANSDYALTVQPLLLSMISGTASYPNKYFNAMDNVVKTYYISGQNSTVSEINNKTGEAIIFNLLDKLSVSESGVFRTIKIENAVVINNKLKTTMYKN